MGIITSIAIQKKNKDRVNIYIDGEFWGGMEAIVALENRLKEGKEVDEATLLELKRMSDLETALKKAINLVTKRLKTEHEMREYLHQKGYDEDTIDAVILKLKSYSYIDDYDYTVAFVATHKNDTGRKKLRYDLKNRGVPDTIIEEVLEHIPNEEERDTAKRLAVKYLKNKSLDEKTKKSLSNYLYSRGFEWDTYADIIGQLFRGEEN